MIMRIFIGCLLGLGASSGVAATTVAPQAEQFDLPAFGIAYLFLLGTLLLASVQYVYCRWQWVLTPTPWTRRYSVALMVIAAFYIIFTVAENQLLRTIVPPLPYAAVPHALMILLAHYVAYRDEEPANITLAISLTSATAVLGVLASVLVDAEVRLGQWSAGIMSLALIAFTLYKSSVSRKSFTTGRYFLESDEPPEAHRNEISMRWPSMGHWVAVVAASVVVAVLARIMSGVSPGNLLAADILLYSSLVLGATLVVAGIPTGIYWLLRRRCPPDLTWTGWMVWFFSALGLIYLQHLTAGTL